MKTLFTNCILLATGDDDALHVLRDHCLLVENDTIAYIGPAEGAPAWDTRKDMDGAVLMPGLVNAHGHTPMTLVRGVGDGLPLQSWLNDAIFPLEARMTPEDIVLGQNWGILEMLRSGITMVSDMYDFPWAAGKALMESGMKGNICRVGLSFSETAEIPPRRFAECEELVRDWKDPSGRVVADFCIHSEYLTNETFVRRVAEANADLHACVNLHLSETRTEHEECKARHGGRTPLQYFNDCGLLDQPTYAAHCVWVSPEDMALMAEKGVTAVHNASSNCKLGSGFSPVSDLIRAGVNVALGTDGVASNNNLNMFEEMHLCSLLRKAEALDPTMAPAEETLRLATVNGARALGRKDTGMLKVGMKADLTAISLDAPHMFPCFDVPALLVYSAQAGDVVMTMVDGRILYEKGEYFTIDAEKVRYEMRAALSHIHGNGMVLYN